VVSPYTQTGAVDSTFYSMVSALRTMELLLGAEPMSKYDTLATPMVAESLKIDFSKPDRIPMALINEILWKGVRGAHSQVPSTVHSVAALHPRLDNTDREAERPAEWDLSDAVKPFPCAGAAPAGRSMTLDRCRRV